MGLGEKVILIKDKACKTSSRKKNKLHCTWRRLQGYVSRIWRLDHALHKVGAPVCFLYVLRSFPCTISEGATHNAPTSHLPAALLHFPSAPHQQPSTQIQLAASVPPSWRVTWRSEGRGRSARGGTWSWLTAFAPLAAPPDGRRLGVAFGNCNRSLAPRKAQAPAGPPPARLARPSPAICQPGRLPANLEGTWGGSGLGLLLRGFFPGGWGSRALAARSSGLVGDVKAVASRGPP